jgi:para-aminobenzoate synthetase component 1
MTLIEPLVHLPPGMPATCIGRSWERSRFEWRLGDPGDPAALVSSFLSGYGLGVPTERPAAGSGDVCGAALLVSAAGGAAMIGGAQGRPSPAPEVPDVVAVVFTHTAPTVPQPSGDGGGREHSREGAGEWAVGPWRPSWPAAAHAAAVDAVRAAIAAGDVYQVNLVGHARAPYSGNPVPALLRVTALAGARYPGLLAGQDWIVACASPETLVEVSRGVVTTRPIKGTRPATPAGRVELLASAKERAEHVMIVDLERNDLAHVARTGSVVVDELFAVRRWCDLWQAESSVSADLVDGLDLADLLRAVCPGGSVTGAPKLAALAQLAALEPVGRGPAMGVLGWIGPDRLDLGLTIRTVAATPDALHIWAGGGITWGSDPAAEVAEAAAKAAPVLAALAAH